MCEMYCTVFCDFIVLNNNIKNKLACFTKINLTFLFSDIQLQC
jgi:hypothetical protein